MNHAIRSAAVLLCLSGLAAAQPGGPAPSKSAPAGGATSAPAGNPSGVGGGVKLEQVKAYTNIEKSELRERSLALLQELARSDNALLRANAVEGLQPAPARCEPLVRAALTDDNVGVRFAAAMTVGRLKLKSSAPLVRPLLSDTDPSVRASAIFALSKTGQNVDQTELASMLMSGDLRARSNAAYILGELGNPSATPMLRDAARQNNPGEAPIGVRLFRLQLAEALVKLGDKPSADVIEAALYPSNRDDFEAAVLAAQIIGEVKIEKAAGQLVNLIEMQPTGSPKPADPRQGVYLQPRELRLAAAASMAKLGYYGGWYVGDSYASDPEPAVRAQAAFVLGATAKRETVNASISRLEKLLDDDNPMVQCSAAAAMLKMLERG